jgi:hypothetical protein
MTPEPRTPWAALPILLAGAFMVVLEVRERAFSAGLVTQLCLACAQASP